MPNGSTPWPPPVEGLDTFLYGTTGGGGTNQEGTVYKLTLEGKQAWLYSFCAVEGCPDGNSPLAGLVQGLDGGLFGTTWVGGAADAGTAFTISTRGKFTTLNSFCEETNCADGAQPVNTLAAGNDGYNYGTAQDGGASGNYGVIFKTDIVNHGARETLYTFCSLPDCADGYNPRGPLTQASDGNFYGTTEIGGVYGFGTVFQFNPVTLTLTTIYSFCQSSGCPDGGSPSAGVIQGADGNFYGVTPVYGPNPNGGDGEGVVFQLTPQGVLKVLHTFTGPDGHGPVGLLQATDGNLYGMTNIGGAHNQGTIFEVATGGTFTKLHDFAGREHDGAQPEGGLMQKTDGNLYGSTTLGGSSNKLVALGAIFRFETGLSPFVKLLPAVGPAQSVVQIYGPNLAGATSVTFNGVPATNVIVVSPTLIYTAVPAGATSGPVTVTTPAGTLASNVAFSVLP
jgi:uncharacterized repeat protein (TIGR03803 family)